MRLYVAIHGSTYICVEAENVRDAEKLANEWYWTNFLHEKNIFRGTSASAKMQLSLINRISLARESACTGIEMESIKAGLMMSQK